MIEIKVDKEKVEVKAEGTGIEIGKELARGITALLDNSSLPEIAILPGISTGITTSKKVSDISIMATAITLMDGAKYRKYME